MNTCDLEPRLLAEGCNKGQFAIGHRAHDAFCLVNHGGTWDVFYSERGQDSTPIFSSRSEQEACDFFISTFFHWNTGILWVGL